MSNEFKQFIDDVASEEEPIEEEEEPSIHRPRISEQISSKPRGTYDEFMDQFKGDERNAAALIEERHESYMQEVDRERGDMIIKAGRMDTIDQKSLEPTVHDPKLWVVHTKPGQEWELVTELMQRAINTKGSLEEVPIISAIQVSSLRGYVYIESKRKGYVLDAIRDHPSIVSEKILLVPINEMTQVLNVKRVETLQPDDWVRITRGTYRGDLAQVVEAKPGSSEVTIRVVPRLDLSETTTEPRKRKNPRMRRHPQKFFDPEEITRMGGSVETKRDIRGEKYEIYAGLNFKDGYLIKTQNVKTITTGDIHPTVSEVQQFRRDIHSTFELPRRRMFEKDDIVRVVGGDLVGLMGIVDRYEEDRVIVKPSHELLRDLLSFPPSQLVKHFDIGDHVQIIQGTRKGETGTVVATGPQHTTILTDVMVEEISVFTSDLKKSRQTSSGMEALGYYSLHDLVEIDKPMTTVGVIVKVDVAAFSVLDITGQVRLIKLSDMGRKLIRRRSESIDVDNNPINKNDEIIVVGVGDYRGVEGRILHIYRTSCFVKSDEIMTNGGVFVVRTPHVRLIGGKNRENLLEVYNQPNSSSFNYSRRHGRARRGDEIIGKTVQILDGREKGLMGIVTDSSDTTLRVQLDISGLVITVPRESVDMPDIRNEYSSRDIWGGDSKTPRALDPTTPHADSGKTPMRVDTPMRSDLNIRDETWDPSVQEPINIPDNPSESPIPIITPITQGQFNSPGGQIFSSPQNTPTPSPGLYETPKFLTPQAQGAQNMLELTDGIEISYGGRIGVVKSLSEASTEIYFPDNSETLSLNFSDITKIIPEKNDKVKIIKGDRAGKIGILISIDGRNGILKLEQGIRLVDLSYLGKYVET